MNNALNVYWGDRLTGRLWLDDKRNFVFQYDSAWLSGAGAQPLSLRLPLRPEPFADNASKPFFSNLLPEARVRALIAKGLGVSEKNDFKLLAELGGECAGAISLLPESLTPETEGSYQLISSEELAKLIKEMPRRPLLTATDGARLSLAGAQNKLPVYVKDGAIYLPRGSFPSSHILKPKIPEFKDTVENEAFCMMLAEKCGLPVPKISINAGQYRSCLIERYDREPGVDGLLARIHQEDFCQALGYGYDQKYESEGGPSLKTCFALLTEYSAEPVVDKRNLLRWIVFNYLIGNCDAHAKNISILFAKKQVRLAPFYDLMSTRIYSGLAEKLAMKIGGENRIEWIMRRHWERLAGDADVGAKAVVGVCQEMCASLPGLSRSLAKTFVQSYGAEETILKIHGHISKMANELSEILKWVNRKESDEGATLI
jgi:serine/threonine-protein kinase HipA